MNCGQMGVLPFRPDTAASRITFVPCALSPAAAGAMTISSSAPRVAQVPWPLPLRRNSTLSLGSTATTPLPSSSIAFLVNSSTGRIGEHSHDTLSEHRHDATWKHFLHSACGTVQSAIRAIRPSTTILWRTLEIVRRLARDRRFSSWWCVASSSLSDSSNDSSGIH